MALNVSSTKRAPDTGGEDIKIFRDGSDRAIQAIVIVDDDGNITGIDTNPTSTKITDGTDVLDIIGDGDSLTGIKGLLIFGEDISGNAKVISVISEGDDTSTLTGFLTYGKDVNGDALPISIISEGDSLSGLTGLLSYGKDLSGNALPISIITEGDSLSGLTGGLSFGKDINGDALPVSIVAEGDSLSGLKGTVSLGKDVSGNAKPLRVIAEGDRLAGLEGLLFLGKDVNGDALPLSIVADGDSASGLKGVYLFGKDSDGNIAPVLIDGESGALITIDTEHANIHKGITYERHIDTANATASALNVAFKTGPAGDVNIILGFSASDTILFEVLEGATWTQGSGTALDVFNNKRSAGPSTLVLEDKNQASFTASNQVIQDVTGISGGTVFENQYTYEAKKVGGSTRDAVHEWELDADTTYVFRITKTSAGDSKMSIDLHWYEVR